MVADNPRCDSPVAEKLPENSEWVEVSQQLPALPNPPAPIPETSRRVFDPVLADRIGLLEAIFICQLHYWLTNSKAGYCQRGFKWIYNGYKEWLVQLPFFKSVDVLGRVVRNLERMGLIETGNFNHNPYDRRKWYRILYEELARRYGWNPLNLPILQESRMDNAAIQNGFCEDTESYTDYPQNQPQENNNSNNDAFLRNGKEVGGTATVTVNESVEVGNECRTENGDSTPETTTTTVEEPSPNEVTQNVISEEPSKRPQQTPSRSCTENHKSAAKPKKRKEINPKIENPEADGISEALTRAGLLSPKLLSLALKFTLDEVNKAIALLQKPGQTINNRAGWFTKCLRGKWWKQSERKKTKPKKSWENDFSSWYEWAIAEGIVEDAPLNYLSTDSRGEPYVRLAQPNRFSNAPYTLEHWRTTRKQFPMPDGALEKLSSSLPTDDPPPTVRDDWEQNCQIQSIEENSTSDEFLDSSPGDVSRKSSSNHLPETPSFVARNHPIESVTEDSSLDNPPDSSPGDVSQNFDPDDSPTALSSVEQSPPVESVNENGLSESPPETSSGSVSRKVAFDFTDPDWMTFPWEPKNGWQPGTERERSRRHKAEWCRSQLLRVSSDEEMHELFNQLGDCALACLEWVDRHLLTPHEIATRHVRMEAGRNYEQQSLLE